jgi:hypothetical protein
MDEAIETFGAILVLIMWAIFMTLLVNMIMGVLEPMTGTEPLLRFFEDGSWRMEYAPYWNGCLPFQICQ